MHNLMYVEILKRSFMCVSEEQEEGDMKKKRKGRKRKKGGEGEEEDAEKSEDEANEIEELLIGLKETPEDVSFTLSSAPPPPSSTFVESVVPEPKPLPQEAKGAVGDEASALQKGRHEIRKLVKKLSEETKIAAKLEAERRERVKKERLKVTYLLTKNSERHMYFPMKQIAVTYKTIKYDTM